MNLFDMVPWRRYQIFTSPALSLASYLDQDQLVVMGVRDPETEEMFEIAILIETLKRLPLQGKNPVVATHYQFESSFGFRPEQRLCVVGQLEKGAYLDTEIPNNVHLGRVIEGWVEVRSTDN